MTPRWIAPLLGLFPAGLLLAGCATASIEDAVPEGALPQIAAPADATTEQPPSPVAEEAVPVVAPAEARAPTAGTYPNLNVAPSAAAPQITPQQRASEAAGLRAKRDQLARETGGAGAGDDSQKLRTLANTHADKVLKEIEGE